MRVRREESEGACRARLLRELRDAGKITFDELCDRYHIDRENLVTGSGMVSLIKDLEILRDTGLIDFESEESYFHEPQGEITVNRHSLASIQHALGISLLRLGQFDPDRSLLVTPFLGRPDEERGCDAADVFVAMPFIDALRPVYDNHIRKVVNNLHLRVARADDAFSAQSVIADMWNAIFNSKIVIADCTGRNPNVFYEIGTAHVLGKPVILITQAVDDIPFDLRYIRFILYEFTPQGMCVFESRLQATIKEEMGDGYPATLAELGSKPHIPWPTTQLDPKEPCYCGSGKRYENCHGIREQSR